MITRYGVAIRNEKQGGLNYEVVERNIENQGIGETGGEYLRMMRTEESKSEIGKKLMNVA